MGAFPDAGCRGTRPTDDHAVAAAPSARARAFNLCTGQLARNASSGAMSSRGPGNRFHHNKIYGNAGSGLRVGGDRPGDATGNDMFENVVTDNARGGIKVMDAGPHGKVCGNSMSGNVGGNVVGNFATSLGDPTAPC